MNLRGEGLNQLDFVQSPKPLELDGPKLERKTYFEDEDVVLVADGNGNMVDPSFITRKYLGVTYHKRNKKWIAQASENGRSKYLGCFKTPEKAARMYDAYVVSKGGENVKTNFPITEIDPDLKPLVKRYKKRSRDVMNFQQIQMQEPWESYLSGLSEQYAKRRKRSRDPTAPKGPRNAYMMYIQKNREKLQRECVDSPLEEGNTFGAISRELGRRWKALSAEDRKKFEDLAAEDKVRHEREKREYESKIKDDEETQRNQEAYLSHLEIIQQHYQEYAKLQTQWLGMMGYGPTPGADPSMAGAMGAPPGAMPQMGPMGSQMMGYDAPNACPYDPTQMMPQMPAQMPEDPATAAMVAASQMQLPNVSESPVPNPGMQAPGMQGLPNPGMQGMTNPYFGTGDDCSDMYEGLGYSAEEMASLQNAWFAAAQQAQLAAMESLSMNKTEDINVKGTTILKNEGDDGLDGLEDQSERKDFD